MITNRTGFKKSLHPCTLDKEVALALEGLKLNIEFNMLYIECLSW